MIYWSPAVEAAAILVSARYDIVTFDGPILI